MERAILGIRLKDKVKISEIKSKTKFNLNFLHAIRRLKWDWAGHVDRLENNKWAKQILDWWIKGGRKRGKQKLKWRNEIDQLFGHR